MELITALDAGTTVTGLIYLIFGIAIGVIFGAIPGLSTAATVAILVPWCLDLESTYAILLMMGTYKGGVHGGSISAILLNIPGTPAAVPTQEYGNPLTRKGFAKKTLSVDLWSSALSDLMSNILLVIGAQYLVRFTANLTSGFVVALIFIGLILSVLLTAVDNKLSARQKVASITNFSIAICIGLLLGSIGGNSEVHAGVRFDLFGNWAGILPIPFIVGAYALPELFKVYANQRLSIDLGPTLKYSELWLYKGSIGLGVLVGFIVGLIPGIGPHLAARFSTMLEKLRPSSRNCNDQIYKNLRRVSAAEAGNSGVTGSSLIPFLVLGVPGDVIVAALSGIFIANGIPIGGISTDTDWEKLKEPIQILLFSPIFLFLIGLFAHKSSGYLLRVKMDVLYPLLLCVCILGCYVNAGSIYGVGIMFGAALLSIVLRALSIDKGYVVIGLIVGSYFEAEIVRTLIKLQAG